MKLQLLAVQNAILVFAMFMDDVDQRAQFSPPATITEKNFILSSALLYCMIRLSRLPCVTTEIHNLVSSCENTKRIPYAYLVTRQLKKWT